MVLLMVVTVAYLPIVLPLVLTGVQVSPWDVAKSLFFFDADSPFNYSVALQLRVHASYLCDDEIFIASIS